jgi:hypothetical protein
VFPDCNYLIPKSLTEMAEETSNLNKEIDSLADDLKNTTTNEGNHSIIVATPFQCASSTWFF